MSQYKHGVYIQEEATSLVAPRLAEAALPVVVGAAPVHRLSAGATVPVNEPQLCYTLSEFEAIFGTPGEGDNPEDFPLWQAANVYFGRYRVAPLVGINVFNPATHVTTTGEGDDAVSAPDVSRVTAEDIIGSNAAAGARAGLGLVDEVFPRFRLTPGVILAPRFSKNPTVAKAVETACKNISGFFRATGIIEVSDEVVRYSEAPAWLNDNNLCDKDGNTLAMFGDGLFNGRVEPGAAHLAGCIGGRDQAEDGVPFWSPSNFQLEVEGIVHNGNVLHLTPAEANYLNGQGIVTGLNMIGGLVCWGDQTTAYPGVTDVKDASIPIRRMFTWVGNTIILTCWQYVSAPVRRRMIENVQDTVNYWLNGLVGRGYLLGGRCEFTTADNPTTDLMAGKARWHLYLTPPAAGTELDFILEYDPNYLNTLFTSSTVTE